MILESQLYAYRRFIVLLSVALFNFSGVPQGAILDLISFNAWLIEENG